MTLTEFILDRIAEDERHARKLAESDRRPVLSLAVTVNHPARILAECEAKRRIVALHRPSPEYDSQACVLCQWDVDCDSPKHDHQYAEGVRDEWPCETMLALALPYADHDDYDERWRP